VNNVVGFNSIVGKMTEMSQRKKVMTIVLSAHYLMVFFVIALDRLCPTSGRGPL